MCVLRDFHAKVIDVSLELNVNGVYGRSQKIHFVFSLLKDDVETAIIRCSEFKSNILKSRIGKIASDFGAVINAEPYAVTFGLIKDIYCDVTTSVATSDSGSQYIRLECVKAFSGIDTDKALLDAAVLPHQIDTHIRRFNEALLNASSSTNQIAAGDYYAIISSADSRVSSRGDDYILIKLMVEQEDHSFLEISVTEFYNNPEHHAVIKQILNFCESHDTDELKGVEVQVSIDSRRKDKSTFYYLSSIDFKED